MLVSCFSGWSNDLLSRLSIMQNSKGARKLCFIKLDAVFYDLKASELEKHQILTVSGSQLHPFESPESWEQGFGVLIRTLKNSDKITSVIKLSTLDL